MRELWWRLGFSLLSSIPVREADSYRPPLDLEVKEHSVVRVRRAGEKPVLC